VHFSEKGAYKYVSGVREPISIRIDTGLYARFKPLAKRVHGSVCRSIELYITTLIESVETGVHFSHTERPINIDKIVIERNLRPRRKLEFEDSFEDHEISSVVEGSRDSCAVCGRPSFARGINKDGSRVFLCRSHFRDWKKHFVSWAYVKEMSLYE